MGLTVAETGVTTDATSGRTTGRTGAENDFESFQNTRITMLQVSYTLKGPTRDR